MLALLPLLVKNMLLMFFQFLTLRQFPRYFVLSLFCLFIYLYINVILKLKANNNNKEFKEYVSSSVLINTHYFNKPDTPQDLCRSHGDTGLITLCLNVEKGLEA